MSPAKQYSAVTAQERIQQLRRSLARLLYRWKPRRQSLHLNYPHSTTPEGTEQLVMRLMLSFF